ncbi:hypothetical protein STEG23_010497 [Scotinomys teguina]
MASQHINFVNPQSPENGLLSDNMEFTPTQVSPGQWEEDFPNSPVAQLNFPPNDTGSCAKQELQALWEMFTSWLQPEQQSKEQMISQLVWKEFLITRQCKDKSAFKEKWESSGRNMGRFMEGLTDECLNPPVMVHVSMQGQEALFSLSTSLKEAIKLLKEQQSARTSAQENARTPLPVSQDMLLATGHKDSEDIQNHPRNTSEGNGGDSSPGNENDSLIIIQTGQFPEPKNRSISDGNPQNYERTSQVTSRNQEVLQRATSSEDVTMEVQPQIISRSQQTEDCQNHEATSTFEGQKERLHRDPKTYKCKKCPRTFKCPCKLSAHQKVHKKERSFVCTTCSKGFYTPSDLKVHGAIHLENKPFACSTCERPFSNKTNLKAHERIHTGLKPYTCSQCNRSFRQSSTYHRHQRSIHKSD